MSSVVMAVSVRCWVCLVFYCTENFLLFCRVIKILLCNLDDSDNSNLSSMFCDHWSQIIIGQILPSHINVVPLFACSEELFCLTSSGDDLWGTETYESSMELSGSGKFCIPCRIFFLEKK